MEVICITFVSIPKIRISEENRYDKNFVPHYIRLTGKVFNFHRTFHQLHCPVFQFYKEKSFISLPSAIYKALSDTILLLVIFPDIKSLNVCWKLRLSYKSNTTLIVRMTLLIWENVFVLDGYNTLFSWFNRVTRLSSAE